MKIVGRTHGRDRLECHFGTRRVRPIQGPHTRDAVLLAFDRNHASVLRLLGQILRLIGCGGFVAYFDSVSKARNLFSLISLFTPGAHVDTQVVARTRTCKCVGMGEKRERSV